MPTRRRDWTTANNHVRYINGTNYISGGVPSAENADLARGYANVVVISPFGGRTGPLPAGQFEGLRRFPGADLER